ncbi:hypothetical protein Zmor_012031 [Zophobas morio]|uniref:Small ribosomal subunit protein uS10 n=1 Tax=Zophobas morio TaxID=2755281 RepID=A0AA38LZJ6_9CUCU|nr:hypothetical protein Zmor_012031 [Zophobas morio]
MEKKSVAPSTPLRIRISLTSANLKSVENVCRDLTFNAKKLGVKFRGPVRMPTKILNITTRKTPNGEGSKTWDRYELRIHKRLIDLHAFSKEVVKEITAISIDTGVDIEVTV